MKTSGLIGLSVVVAASLSTAVMAEGTAPQDEMQEMFKKADANADGKLTLEEFKTMAKIEPERKFAVVDANKDGFATLEEIRIAKKAAQAAALAPNAPAQ